MAEKQSPPQKKKVAGRFVASRYLAPKTTLAKPANPANSAESSRNGKGPTTANAPQRYSARAIVPVRNLKPIVSSASASARAKPTLSLKQQSSSEIPKLPIKVLSVRSTLDAGKASAETEKLILDTRVLQLQFLITKSRHIFQQQSQKYNTDLKKMQNQGDNLITILESSSKHKDLASLGEVLQNLNQSLSIIMSFFAKTTEPHESLLTTINNPSNVTSDKDPTRDYLENIYQQLSSCCSVLNRFDLPNNVIDAQTGAKLRDEVSAKLSKIEECGNVIMELKAKHAIRSSKLLMRQPNVQQQ